MVTNVDMFRASMELGIVGEGDSGLIVGKEFGWSCYGYLGLGLDGYYITENNSLYRE